MSDVVNWVMSHEAVLASVAVAVLDLVFALNPNTNAADGVLHWIYLKLKGVGKTQ